jgi:flagellar L-ring protein precursor FlgH
MKSIPTLRTPLLATALLLLAGCGATLPERDAAYAPAYPVASAPPQRNDGAIYQAGYNMSLFEDTKAHRVGDLITVLLAEETTAEKEASTSTGKDQSLSLGAPNLFGAPVLHNGNEILSASVSAGREFSGDGSSSQSNSLSGSITVFVSQVLPNGNLVIRGEKRLTLNQGDEFVRLSGIVRPADVSSNNTVLSTKVANAQILYSGNGAISDANRMGWLGRFFNSPLWPF